MRPFQKTNSDTKQLTVIDHIKELRNRVILCLTVFVILFVAFYLNANSLLTYVISTGEQAGFQLGYLSPQEILVQALRLSSVVALILTVPTILYQILMFVLPAFDSKALKRALLICAVLAYLLFLIGFAFCLFILFPIVYDYLHVYSDGVGAIGYVSIENYLSLFLSTAWVISIAFEMPLFTAALAKCGMLTTKLMLSALRPATVIMFFVAAVITPPDVISMLVVAAPLEIVYLISVVICKVFQRSK